MVPPFSLCVCRFFLSGPPLASGGLSFLPRTFISGRQTQAYCFVCYYCNRIGTKFTKEKTILPNSFLPYTCRILSLICSLAGFFPSYAALPNPFPHMQPCRILSFIITLPNDCAQITLSNALLPFVGRFILCYTCLFFIAQYL